MLSEEQKKVLHYAIDNGFETIECYNSKTQNWFRTNMYINDLFAGAFQLRIKQTPDSIDWTHVSTDIYCMARDEDGYVYFFTEKAQIERDSDFWYAEGTCYGGAEIFASYKLGTVDWKESLVLNPYYKEKK